MTTQTANQLFLLNMSKMPQKYRTVICLFFGMICFTFTSCSDEGGKYVGQWKRLDGQETVEIRKNDKSYILEVGKEQRFTGSIQPDGTLEFSVGPIQSKISIDIRTGNLLIGGQGEYKRILPNDKKAERAESDIHAISLQLLTYEMLNYRMPTTEQGLAALVQEPLSEPKPRKWRKLMKAVIVDPWGSEYVFRNPGIKQPDSVDLFSLGPDKKESSDDIGQFIRTQLK